MREGLTLGRSLEEEVDDRDDNMEQYGDQATRMVEEESEKSDETRVQDAQKLV